jgi:hypothetical protein
MAGSTLTPSNLPAGPDRRLHQGHGTSALGPSDSSDSGSDVQGAPEESTAARDETAHDVADIDTDHVERIVPDADDEEEET